MHNGDMEIDEDRLYQLLGDRLKQRRLEFSKPQAWLAERVGLRRTSITNFEAGRQKVPLHVLYGLSEALEVEVADVLPTLEEVRSLAHEEVAIDEGAALRVLPKTAEVLRDMVDDPTGRP